MKREKRIESEIRKIESKIKKEDDEGIKKYYISEIKNLKKLLKEVIEDNKKI